MARRALSSLDGKPGSKWGLGVLEGSERGNLRNAPLGSNQGIFPPLTATIAPTGAIGGRPILVCKALNQIRVQSPARIVKWCLLAGGLTENGRAADMAWELGRSTEKPGPGDRALRLPWLAERLAGRPKGQVDRWPRIGGFCSCDS